MQLVQLTPRRASSTSLRAYTRAVQLCSADRSIAGLVQGWRCAAARRRASQCGGRAHRIRALVEEDGCRGSVHAIDRSADRSRVEGGGSTQAELGWLAGGGPTGVTPRRDAGGGRGALQPPRGHRQGLPLSKLPTYADSMVQARGWRARHPGRAPRGHATMALPPAAAARARSTPPRRRMPSSRSAGEALEKETRR